MSSVRGSGGQSTTFGTWSHDEPCDTMEWTVLPGDDRFSLEITNNVQDFDSDLFFVGIWNDEAPKEEEEEEEEEEDGDDEEEEPTILELKGKVKEMNDALGGMLSDVLVENYKEFKNGAVAGATTPVVRVVKDGKVQKYVLLGLGKARENEVKDDTGLDDRKVGSAIAKTCNSEAKITKCQVILPLDSVTESNAKTLSDLSCTFHADTYGTDDRFKSKKNTKPFAKDLITVGFYIDGIDGDDIELAEGALAEGKTLAKGVFLAKDIVNAPHNVLNSISMANTARQIAAESDGTMECEILGKDECEKRGMGAFLGVARGSETPPQLIHLTYKAKGDIKRKVGIVGKGLLFDTGGYNIKVGMMELMKFDCGGAAAVLGAARAIAELAPEGVEAHFVVAACENMINDKAIVPSDILTAMNGTTIEVMNTDAEGRLTMADALVYTDKELECERIIELSTLTGACMIALGKGVAGVWTSNDELATELADVSKCTGDRSWRMPLVKEYNEQLKSKFADLSNLGSRYGGAITAGLFLQNFVRDKIPFAHIDIAGPVWSDEIGATGYGAKLTTEWIRRQGKE
eukprot:CAMPEP_0195511634 /NCGR_PEP_ID=MMETSP0794_2-20130614/3889_1 /TAXON_ID=515487 /ORGANISM="Stephanopyxis turris, Strain CCMP 815" /LENGTH=573 /DNA_ID=CAMNT_0040639279 /DNA_START=21 /DNA_END=1742 /DNA_ORIENTATION=-